MSWFKKDVFMATINLWHNALKLVGILINPVFLKQRLERLFFFWIDGHDPDVAAYFSKKETAYLSAYF